MVRIFRSRNNLNDVIADSVTLGAGSEASPSLAFGDGDSGIYEITDDNLQFTLGGVDNLKVAPTLFGYVTSGYGIVLNKLASSTDPVFSFAGDGDTGVGKSGADQLALVAGGVNAVTYIENGGVLQLSQITAGITADTGSSQGDGPLTSSVNEISACANAGDAVTVPSAPAAGSYSVTIINNGANACDVFPASGDDLGAGVNTAVSLAAGANITYVSYDATNWATLT